MNSLSWLIYLGGVVGNLGTIFGIILVALGIFITIGSMITCFTYGGPFGDKKEPLTIPAKVLKFTKLPIILFIIVGILGSFIPTRETVYAIAASEVGEEILTSETGTKAAEALNAWLDRQIEGEPKSE